MTLTAQGEKGSDCTAIGPLPERGNEPADLVGPQGVSEPRTG